MKGLLLFVAGLLCGGAAVAWLFLGREPAPTVAVESSLPAPAATDSGIAGIEDDLPMPRPQRDPHDAPPLEIEPIERVPSPRVAPLPEGTAAEPDAEIAPDPDATDLIGDGRIAGEDPLDDAPPAKADAAVDPDAPAASAESPIAPTPPDPDVLAALKATTLLLPVQGIEPDDLADTYSDARGEGRSHDAIDIMAPTGRPVRAVADGRIAKLFASVPGGLTIYQFDVDERLAFYYAHLDRYADGLEEGATVKKGDLIGYVGATGNANEDAPHLHFAIFVLGPEKRWWQGTPVNPYPVLRRAQTETAGAP
jgi:murein DD-endopeptidase MepM/ murein hydrolase activator NlpD